MIVRVPRDVCIDYARSSKLEWLETNRTSAFAMGTVAGASTRRYHGLLVASLTPPANRFLVLAKLDEVVTPRGPPGGESVELAANQFPGVVHPMGHLRMEEFRRDPFPTWTYRVGGVRLEKRLFLIEGEPSVVVRYRSDVPASMTASAFVAFRDYHALAHANVAPLPVAQGEPPREGGARVVVIRAGSELPPLTMTSNASSTNLSGEWYANFEYLEELDRGFEFREDLYRACSLEFELDAGNDAWIVATLGEAAGPRDARAVDAIESRERDRRRPKGASPAPGRGLADELRDASDAFRARRKNGTATILAGYPWFLDWGRDAMISLPGLLLVGRDRERCSEAREVLCGFLGYLDQGLIPNRFPDHGERPEYNTCDATLWLFQAVRAYLDATSDAAFLREVFYPCAKEIVAWHERGTHHGIIVDARDGLLVAGGPGTQLTWMDAVVLGRVVVARHGKAVEINALYYNALRLSERWAASLGDAAFAGHCRAAADRIAASFEQFWNADRGCLFDVLNEEGKSAQIRPNQIFAVSLPFPLLEPARRRDVVSRVREHLLTPVGLRTLAPTDAAYRGTYAGDSTARDGAYHQGTVWPWLLGPFISAHLAAFGRTAESVRYCRSLLDGLERHLTAEACLGSISEIFDGDAPHAPRGAPAQAWSVAEVARALEGLS